MVPGILKPRENGVAASIFLREPAVILDVISTSSRDLSVSLPLLTLRYYALCICLLAFFHYSALSECLLFL